MGRKLVICIISGLLLVSSGIVVNAADYSAGTDVEIANEHGSYTIAIENAHNVDWNSKRDGVKIITIQGITENIDYGNNDKGLSCRHIAESALRVMDEEGFDLEFNNTSAGNDGIYEVSADIMPSSKKRISLPYYAPENCETVTVVIDNDYSIEFSLDDSGFVDDKAILEEESTELQTNIEHETQLETEIVETDDVEEDDMETETDVQTEESFQKNISESAQDVDVEIIIKVQETLNDLGYDCGTPDGVVGSKTVEAIEQYQEDMGVTVNGIIDDELLFSLEINSNDENSSGAEEDINESTNTVTSNCEEYGNSFIEKLCSSDSKIISGESSMNGENYLCDITYNNSIIVRLVLTVDEEGPLHYIIAVQLTDTFTDDYINDHLLFLIDIIKCIDDSLSTSDITQLLTYTLANDGEWYEVNNNIYAYTFDGEIFSALYS